MYTTWCYFEGAKNPGNLHASSVRWGRVDIYGVLFQIAVVVFHFKLNLIVPGYNSIVGRSVSPCYYIAESTFQVCQPTTEQMQIRLLAYVLEAQKHKAAAASNPVMDRPTRPPSSIDHCAFFLASLARPLARMLRFLWRNILSAMGSGRREMRNPTSACVQ